MSRPTTLERLAVLETEVRGLKETQDKTLSIVTAVQAAQAAVAKDLARYRGAWGAVLLIFSALATALTIGKDWLLSRMQ